MGGGGMGDAAGTGGAGAMGAIEAAAGSVVAGEDNGTGDEGRPQRPIGRVAVGWTEGCLD